MPVPTPEQQIDFLQKMQRLLTEGLFVASYKFALLRALADLAVLKGDDSGEELELSVSDIAKVFVELYWRQTRPFCAQGSLAGQVLRQNTGKQAAVVQTIAAMQLQYGGSLSRLQHDQSHWRALTREVADVVAVMPLWKLQRVGREVVDFLYPNVGQGRGIRLKPGVAYCLRRFYGILRNLVEGAWINYVRSLNGPVLGHGVDVGEFLFGAERAALEVYRPVLQDVQKDVCFYCRNSMRVKGEVDHFIPWSRYPVDLGHNFVLAHRECNSHKSDFLAAEAHLEAWLERNQVHARTLREFFAENHLLGDEQSSVSIARWAYSQTASINGLVWMDNGVLVHLAGDWSRLLAVA